MRGEDSGGKGRGAPAGAPLRPKCQAESGNLEPAGCCAQVSLRGQHFAPVSCPGEHRRALTSRVWFLVQGLRVALTAPGVGSADV